MPVVTVQMWKGRTVGQKRRLAKALTEAMVEHAGANPGGLHVAIDEYPRENWARAGVLGVDRTDGDSRAAAEFRVFGLGHLLLQVNDLEAAREEAASRLGSVVSDLIQYASGFGDGRGKSVRWSDLGPLSVEGEYRDSEVVFGFGGHVALVTADAGTGEIRVERLALGYDCGRAIDPDGVRGQLAGGTAMGVGATLYEEVRYDEEGQPLVTTFMDYLLPTLAEAPDVHVIVFEHPALGNPLGARGAGEAGVIGVGAAIANALADAVGAAQGFTALPLRDERVLAELAAADIPA